MNDCCGRTLPHLAARGRMSDFQIAAARGTLLPLEDQDRLDWREQARLNIKSKRPAIAGLFRGMWRAGWDGSGHWLEVVMLPWPGAALRECSDAAGPVLIPKIRF